MIVYITTDQRKDLKLKFSEWKNGEKFIIYKKLNTL